MTVVRAFNITGSLLMYSNVYFVELTMNSTILEQTLTIEFQCKVFQLSAIFRQFSLVKMTSYCHQVPWTQRK